jgi:arylsulfatase A-like enzyme
MRRRSSRFIANATLGAAFGACETLWIAALRWQRCLAASKPAPICGCWARPGDLILPIAAMLAYALIAGLILWGDRRPRLSLWFLVIASLVLTVLPTPRKQSRAGTGTNIILITLDTVRADHLSLYGYARDTTPHLRTLRDFTTYTNAFSSGNWTLPGHASIFTGQSVTRHGAHESPTSDFHAIAENLPTLPQLLARRGFVTAGVVANYGNLSGPAGFERGFDVYDYVYPAGLDDPSTPHYLPRAKLRNALVTALHSIYRLAPAEDVNRRAFRFLDSQRRPFFLFINYMDAHVPYTPPHPYDTRYPGKSSFAWNDYYDIEKSGRPLTARESQHLVSQYDGAINYLDDQLDQLLRKLRELQLYDDALIVITSDHGESFGERAILGHGRTLYQNQIRIPLLVKLPHATSGARVDTFISDTDILPAILGMRAPTPSPWIVSESFRPGDRHALALMHDSLKLIVPSNELYDLASDPNEQTNLSGKRALPPEWQSIIGARLRERAAHAPTPTLTDPELLRRLRALGYLR